MLRKVSPKIAHSSARQLPRSLKSAHQFDAMVDSGILDCLAPETPFISKKTPIVTMGSCFAGNIAAKLRAESYDVLLLGMMERLFTPLAMKEFVEGLTAQEFNFDLFQENWGVSKEDILSVKSRLSGGSVVIATVGLSTIWVDLETETPIFNPVQKIGGRLFIENPGRYEMRQLTVLEVLEAITSTINAIRKLNKSNKIILTLSPIPLSRAVCDYPVITADCISKSTLRVAIHELMLERTDDVFYFPSFEILKWFAPMFDTIWGEDNMLSHIRNEWIDYVMAKFAQHYCTEAARIKILPPETAKFYKPD